MLSALKEAKVSIVKAEVAAGSTAVTDATIVDMANYDNVAFYAILGTSNADTAKVGLTAILGDKSDLSDGVEDTTNKTEYTFTSATSGDHGVLLLDVLRPDKRYIRCKISRSVANTDILALVAVQYGAACVPSGLGGVIASALKV